MEKRTFVSPQHEYANAHFSSENNSKHTAGLEDYQIIGTIILSFFFFFKKKKKKQISNFILLPPSPCKLEHIQNTSNFEEKKMHILGIEMRKIIAYARACLVADSILHKPSSIITVQNSWKRSMLAALPDSNITSSKIYCHNRWILHEREKRQIFFWIKQN